MLPSRPCVVERPQQIILVLRNHGAVKQDPQPILGPSRRDERVHLLQRLHEKAARGEPFTPTNRVDLILSPLMRQSRPVQDVLREAVPLTQRLPEAQQEPTVGALLGLAYHYVDEDVVRAILEELSMANPLQELIDEREARAKRQAVRTVLQARFGTLPEAVEHRIAAADADQLDALIGRAAIVASPDEL